MHRARRARGAHDEVGAAQRLGQRVERAVLGVRALGERARMLEGSIDDPHRPDAATSQVLHGERSHRAGADDHDLPVGEPADRIPGEVGAQTDERIGCRAERGFLPDATSRSTRRVEQPRQGSSRGILCLGSTERLAHLRGDLRLAEHHRVEPARDCEQVIGGVAFPLRVQWLGELLSRDAAGLDEQPLQRQEPCVIARDLAVDLDPVAGREDHGPLDPLEIADDPVCLGQIVVGEREPLQQLDRRATE